MASSVCRSDSSSARLTNAAFAGGAHINQPHPRDAHPAHSLNYHVHKYTCAFLLRLQQLEIDKAPPDAAANIANVSPPDQITQVRQLGVLDMFRTEPHCFNHNDDQ